MNERIHHLLIAGAILLVAAGVTIFVSRRHVRDDAAVVVSTNHESPTPNHPNRQADKAAIGELAQEFVRAFNQGDAKAIAALYTAQCKYHDETTGELFRSRAEVERAYTDRFRGQPGTTIEIKDPSIRFLSHDGAVHEGVWQRKMAGSETPARTRFRSHCVREAGAWRVALTREWRAD
jgi:uncharacterized protein (TIGR02246 family)